MTKPTKEEIKNYQNQVFEKYNYTCVRCLEKGKVVHELVPKSLNPKWYTDVDNGVCLCIKCHEWAHKFGAKISRPILQDYINAFTF